MVDRGNVSIVDSCNVSIVDIYNVYIVRTTTTFVVSSYPPTKVGDIQPHILPGLQRCDDVLGLFVEDHLSPVVSTNKTVTNSLRYR